MGDKFKNLPLRSGVGIVVLNKNNKVFVAKRIDNPKNFWQMPQGGIDPGEDAQEAALRELEEETGITRDKVTIIAQTQGWIPYDLPADLISKLWNGKYRGQKQKWFLMRFMGDDSDINIDTEEPEFSVWKWIAPSDLPDAIVPFKRDVYVAVLEAFQNYL